MGQREFKNPRWTVYEMQNLGAGLFTEGSGFNSPEGSASIAKNVVFAIDGSIQVRPGLSFAFASSGVRYPQSLFFNGTQKIITRDEFVAGFQGTVYVNGVGVLDSAYRKWIAVAATQNTGYAVSDTGVYQIAAEGGNLRMAAPVNGTVAAGTPTAGGSLDNGSSFNWHQYTIAFVDPLGNESYPVIPTTALQNITFGGANRTIPLTITLSSIGSIPLTTLYQKINVYRRVSSAPSPDLYATDNYILVTVISVVNGTTVYTFNDAGSTTLQGPRVERQAMNGGTLATVVGQRLWTANARNLYYSDPGAFLFRSGLAFEEVNLASNENITAIAPYQRGVVIFGKRSASYLTDVPLTGGSFVGLQIAEGCLNNNAWALVDDGIAFLGPSGVWLFRGGTTVLVNEATRSLTKAVNEDSAALVYDPKTSRLYVSVDRRLVVYQFGQNRSIPAASLWEIGPTAKVVADDAALDQWSGICLHNGDLLHTENRGGFIFNASTDYSASVPGGVGIDVQWRTTPFSAGDAGLFKIFRRADVMLAVSDASQITVKFSTRFGYNETVEGSGDNAQPLAVWDVSLWDVAIWDSSTVPERPIGLSCSTGMQGRYAVLEIDAAALTSDSLTIFPPLSIQYRTRDRLGVL